MAPPFENRGPATHVHDLSPSPFPEGNSPENDSELTPPPLSDLEADNIDASHPYPQPASAMTDTPTGGVEVVPNEPTAAIVEPEIQSVTATVALLDAAGDITLSNQATVSAAAAILTPSVDRIIPVRRNVQIDRNTVINRADPDHVRLCESIIDNVQKRLIGKVRDKVRRKPQRYARDNYEETATMLILSNWPSAK